MDSLANCVKDAKDTPRINTLIVSPHADDEIFGAFTFLKDSVVFFAGIDESNVKRERPSKKVRLSEVQEVSKECGYGFNYAGLFVNEYYKDLPILIHDIETIIEFYHPKNILIPFPDTNQDHQAVYKACTIALRPHDTVPFVPNVIMYETPGSYLWGPRMEANYFRPLNLNKKIHAYNLYETQVRSYRSHKILQEMAQYRGRQSRMKYAEGFKVIRLCQEKML